jgi:cytochrome c oxidase assembly protein subunit 15
MVVLCVLTGRDWNSGTPRAADPDHLRQRSAVVLALVYAQIVLGSWLRHYGTGTALWSHGLFAVAVWVNTLLIVYRIERQRTEVAPLVLPSRALGLTSSLQIILGLAALVFLLPFDGMPRAVTFYQGIVRTGHQTNAALLFAASIVLTFRAYRHLAGTAALVAAQPEERPLERPEPAALDWEAVA